MSYTSVSAICPSQFYFLHTYIWVQWSFPPHHFAHIIAQAWKARHNHLRPISSSFSFIRPETNLPKASLQWTSLLEFPALDPCPHLYWSYENKRKPLLAWSQEDSRGSFHALPSLTIADLLGGDRPWAWILLYRVNRRKKSFHPCG